MTDILESFQACSAGIDDMTLAELQHALLRARIDLEFMKQDLSVQKKAVNLLRATLGIR